MAACEHRKINCRIPARVQGRVKGIFSQSLFYSVWGFLSWKQCTSSNLYPFLSSNFSQSVPFFSLEFILSFCELIKSTDYCICAYFYRTRWCMHSCIMDSFTEVTSLEIIDSPTTIINFQYSSNHMCDVLYRFSSQAEFLYFVQVLWMLFNPLWAIISIKYYSSNILFL